MRLIEPIGITDAVLLDSNVPENDHPEWSASTAYVEGDKVIVLSTHRVYEALVDNTDVDPVTDDGTTWLDIGATERWRVFDEVVGTITSRTSLIYYKLMLGQGIGGRGAIGLLGLLAGSVQIRITDPIDGVVYDQITQLVDNSGVSDWQSYLFEPINFGQRIAVFDLPIFGDSEVEIWVLGVGNVEAGQIVIGPSRTLGTVGVGAGLGLLDFSKKDRDDFGNLRVVERAFALTTDFPFMFPASDGVRVQGIVARNRARPTIWSAGDDTDKFGTLIYGIVRDFSVDLTSNNIAFANLEIEGLT